MSNDRCIRLVKELLTKPPSIGIDRKGVNFVVFAFSTNQTCYRTVLNPRFIVKHPKLRLGYFPSHNNNIDAILNLFCLPGGW
jgi:hypothetical protein